MTAPTDQEVIELAAADVVIPERDSDDPAELASWYYGGSAAFVEYFRKCIQAQCREVIRAKYALAGEKITESRLDDLSRLHPGYLGYLTTHLAGRIKFEGERLKNGVGG